MFPPPAEDYAVEETGTCTRHLHRVEEELYRGRSPYQRIELLRNREYGAFLLLDGDFQSAAADEYIYHEALVHPAMVCHPGPRRVLILGGGEGSTLREVLRHPGVQEAVVVELDRQVVEACRRYAPEFAAGAYEDPRARLEIGDARAWVERNPESYDVIVSDLTDPRPGSPSAALFSQEFFTVVRSRLQPGGILAVQASRCEPGRMEVHASIHCTLEEVFPRVRSYKASIPTFFSDWSFLTASEILDPGDLCPAEVDRRLERRGLQGLRFYDGETHLHMMSLPRPFRHGLTTCGHVLRDAPQGASPAS